MFKRAAKSKQRKHSVLADHTVIQYKRLLSP